MSTPYGYKAQWGYYTDVVYQDSFLWMARLLPIYIGAGGFPSAATQYLPLVGREATGRIALPSFRLQG